MCLNRLLDKFSMAPPKFENHLTIFLVLHVCFIMCFHAATTQTTNSAVCETEACKSIASSILHKMNRTVDPCNNFYEYACGNFTKNSVIPPEISVNFLHYRLREKVYATLRDDLENKITDDDPEAFQKLLTFYNTCMNQNQIERTSNNDMLEILEKLGGWPVLLGESYDSSKFEWNKVINKINCLGYIRDYFLGLSIDSDLKNNTRYRININAPTFSISQAFLSEGLDNTNVKAYFEFMLDVAEILGADRTKANEELGLSLNFEIQLAKIFQNDSELDEDGKYNLMKISEVQTKYPFIRWLKYINDILSLNVNEEEVVVVNVPTFLTSLGELLAATPNRTLSNFLLWRTVFESSKELNQKVQDANLKFVTVVNGKRNVVPRWRTCLNYLETYMYAATSSLYAQRHFNKSSIKDGFSDMLERIRQGYKTIILEADWMDDATKNTAVNKLEKMLFLIGHSDEDLDVEKVDKYYKNLKLVPKSFVRSVLRTKQFVTKKILQRYRKPIPRFDWPEYYTASFTVNSYYFPSQNTALYLAGMIQGDFYDVDFPKYVNFGAIGYLVAHEMTHALDTTGRRYDAIGNYVDWWPSDTEKKFLEKAECFVGQYSNFTVPQVNLTVNGEQTLAENIADNGGMKEVYQAYVAYEKEKGAESILPGFENFTGRQLLWLSSANVWCAKYRDEFLRREVLNDVHSPNEFRVNGPMSNNPHFAEDYNCPLGSPMNPVNKCSLW